MYYKESFLNWKTDDLDVQYREKVLRMACFIMRDLPFQKLDGERYIEYYYAESCVYVLKINIFTGFPIYTIVEARSPYEAIEIGKSPILKEYKKIQELEGKL